MNEAERSCIRCKKKFLTKDSQKIYCENSCRHSAYLPGPLYPNTNTSKTGALSELMVCVDLLKNGYDVFRSVSPDAKWDVIAIKNDEVLNIEVRTARLLRGELKYPKNRIRGNCLALVAKEGITYRPPIQLGISVCDVQQTHQDQK